MHAFPHFSPFPAVAFSWFSWMLLLCLTPAGAIEPEWVMFSDPVLVRPVIRTQFPPGLVDLWSRALETEERELQRRAAAAIAEAHQMGLEGLDATAGRLVEILRQPDSPRNVRLTVARTLVVLEAQSAADVLFAELARGDLEMAEIVVPGLVQWRDSRIEDWLLERLTGEETIPRWHLLAIQGLTQLESRRARVPLNALIAEQQTPVAVRLEAAGGLGQLVDDDLLELATTLANRSSSAGLVDRLAAARVLARHRGKDAERLLTQLALDPRPAVQTIALGHLFRISPDLVLAVVPRIKDSSDAGVRRWAAEALIERPSEQHLGLLSNFLGDHDPALRREVADALLRFAEEEKWRETVIRLTKEILAGEDWRALEQATLVLVSLDQKAIVDRLLELLAIERPEVHTTAAWGLSRLQVPRTAQPMLEVLDDKSERFLNFDFGARELAIQMAHLSQALGALRYSPAKDVLERFVPKGTTLTSTPRSAAIWALGHLPETAEDPQLIDNLRLRMIDVNSMEPESPEVRTMSAVTLGRIGADSEVVISSLRMMLRIEKPETAAGYSCAWALRELLGEPLPEVRPAVYQHDGWFLTPLAE